MLIDCPIVRHYGFGMMSPGQVLQKLRKMTTQEGVVFLITAALFIVFSTAFKGFLAWENIANLLLNVSLLGVLALGMGFVVIGRGLDLSVITVALCSSALVLQLLNIGAASPVALGAGFCLAIVVGVSNGMLIAFIEIPALFATLATGLFFLGITEVFLVTGKITYLPASDTEMLFLAQGRLAGVPVPIIAFAALAAVSAIILKTLVYGRYLYAMGENLEAANLSGVPVRPMMVANYVACSMFGFIGGLLIASASASVNFQLAGSTFVFNVILVIVLGGVSLIGGRGSVLSVLAGTLLIGTLLDGLIVMNLNSDAQDIVKGLVLICAILLDRVLHPIDEETAKQGDTI
jgi:ribose transport system permease protein